MAYSYVSYIAIAGQTQYIVPFPYLAQTHVKVSVNGVNYAAYSWLSDTQIQILTVTTGDRILISRETSPELRLVDFVIPGQLTEEDLDTAFTQIHNLSQEAQDKAALGISEDPATGVFSTNGTTLTDIPTPVNPTDAVNKTYADGLSVDVGIKHADVVVKHAAVVTESASVSLLHSQLTSLTTAMTSLPYGTDGSVTYNSVTGLLTFSLSEGPAGVQGPVGLTGDVGAQGPIGNQGVIGPEGPIGPQGTIGNTGNTGDQGVDGIQGITGNTGPVGPQGIQGVTGDQGAIGSTGLTGAQGATGDAGPLGPTGSQGPLGPTGPLGPEGIQGSQGGIGSQGPVGDQGSLGPTGTAGPVGAMGPTALGLAFGTFTMNPTTGMLTIEYYGSAADQDFAINSNGELEVTI